MILVARALPQYRSGLMYDFAISGTMFQCSLIARVPWVGEREASLDTKRGYDEFSDLVFII